MGSFLLAGDCMLEQGSLAASNRIDLTDRDARPRLLVVEDDTIHRMLICRTAANAGYVPAGAASCDEAVKLLKKDVFDCLTLDLSLGSRDGDEILRYLGAAGSRTHVIIISSHDNARRDESMALARSLGLNVWESIAKPVDMVVLRYWLERLKTEYVTAAAVAA
jgi:two-component system, chemotaxis family, chemotaxis protein CheY